MLVTLAFASFLSACGSSDTKNWSCVCSTNCQNIDLSTRRFPVCARKDLAAEAARFAKSDCDSEIPQECRAVEFRACNCACEQSDDNC
ncbi:MAG: hypothetical protein IT384_18155 [Deltaproteobacteria bacterium]|nr:hypothetical protein [Deltaproteobacteria bacterium]